ncbi:MAG: tetratricopeptide repeat protein [Devosia sp.]
MRDSILVRLAGAMLIALTLSLPAGAVDTGGNSGDNGSANVPSMSEARAEIKAKHWSDAIATLKLIIADNSNNADAYNLLGYSYRNSGDFKRAQQAYTRALKLDPKHTGALEYQGVLYVMLGDIDKAKANLAKIKGICGTSCEEYEDLDEAIPG